MDSTLPIAMIGKSLNHRLFIFDRFSTFEQNLQIEDYDISNDYVVRYSGSAVVRICLPSCRILLLQTLWQQLWSQSNTFF